jgi:hypothetical protein
MPVRSRFVLLLAAAVLAGCAAQGGSGEPPPGSGAAPPPDPGAARPAPPAAGAAPGEARAPEIPAVDGRRAWSGQVSAAFNDMFVTAREPRGWDLVWQLVGEPPPGPLPEGAMAVAVFLGSRPTGGYAVDVVGMSYRPDQVLAFYRETEPPEDAVVTQQLTAPWTVRLAPASPLPVHYLTAEEQ